MTNAPATASGLVGLACLSAITAFGVLRAMARGRRPRPLPDTSQRLLIVAPHPDDCVIMAGCQAASVLGRGGAVRIVYVTTGADIHDDVLAATRRAEARGAWSELEVGDADLVFLEHPGDVGLESAADLHLALTELTREIRRFAPDRIVMPLYEGGHYQHDATSLVTVRAAQASGLDVEMFEAPEYNFYFSWRRTPEKMLGLMSRCVPGWNHEYPPEPIDDRPILATAADDRVLAQKARMIGHFISQSPAALLRSAGGPDRLQRFEGRDYTQPPFRYTGSFAWWIDHLKCWPVVGGFLGRSFKRTRTLHSDPEYRMTHLPVAELDAIDAGAGAKPASLKEAG